MPSRPDPNSQRSRARAAGISASALRQRDRAAERHAEAVRAVALDPAAPAWIGARIHPPIEPDHPLSIERAERIRRRHGEAGAVWPVAGCNA